MKLWLKVFTLLSCMAPLPLLAAGPGDEVVVVYNSTMPESKQVAYHYALKRHVPTNQVFGLDLPKGEDITRAEFADSLQKPLYQKLEAAKLWRTGRVTIPATTNQPERVESKVVESKIRYAALCYGVPLRILPDPKHREPGMESLRVEMQRNEAAVDNELALLPSLRQGLPLAGPLRNWAFTTTNTAMLHPTNGLLLVARLDGPTPEIAAALVDKAIQAETDGLWGRAYFDLRNTDDPNLKSGDEWIFKASEVCRHLGWETVVDRNPGLFPASFPMSQIGIYAGWYAADIHGALAAPKVEFMPGAFAYHLHSFSAVTLRSTNQAWAGPLLARGVTATMGTVHEPYLAGTPDIGIFMARWLYNGFSFGEAAYSCQSILSWMTTVVGDPLYRPCGRNPDQLQEDLRQRGSPMYDWAILRLLTFNLVAAKPLSNCVKYLEELPLTRKSAVLSEKLGDLYLEQGKPSSAVHAWQQALKENPSPMQAVRLLLTLGEKLPSLDREAEACEALQTVLNDHPEYPDKLGLCQKLLPLAQKLGKKADAEKYETQIKALTTPPPAPAITEP